jgi:putative ABC transport system ATP-binding protein
LELAAGEVVFNQGDRGELVYVVEEGAIEIVRIRDDGTEERVNEIDPGSYFGEFSPMFGLPRSATARALRPTVVTGYGLRDFRDRFQVLRPRAVLAGGADAR